MKKPAFHTPFSATSTAIIAALSLTLPACATSVTTPAPIANAVVASSATSVASNVDEGHGHDHHGQFGTPKGDIADAIAGTYKIEPTHAYISFTYNHLGFSYPVIGFNSFDGSVTLDPANLADTTVSVTIDPASIDSRVEVFDGHLRGENFFNVAKYPEITFESTAALPESSGNGKIAGNLTIKDITKPVILDVVLHKVGENPFSKKAAIGISAKTTIKRSEWDLGAYAPNVSDEVEITISAEFLKQ